MCTDTSSADLKVGGRVKSTVHGRIRTTWKYLGMPVTMKHYENCKIHVTRCTYRTL